MKSRFVASIALGAAVMLGATGCAMLAPQATTIEYSPSDGVNIPDSGPLQLRNVLLIANEDGTKANLIAAVVNDTDKAHTLNMEIGEGSRATQETVRVPANTVVVLGSDDHKPLALTDIDSLPGTNTPIYFQSGDAEGVLWDVPVLDGSLEYLEELAP